MSFLRNPPRGNIVTNERKKELHLFEGYTGLRFRKLELLNQAFSHRSYANEVGADVHNNERLEFLGDSVLGLVVAEYLYRELSDRPEGDLARIKSFVVSEDSLAEIARRIRVDNFILIGKGEEHSGGRGKKAILADAMEAIIGAYFLDSGFKAARKFVLKLLVPEIRKVLEDRHRKDYKTLLQELVQKRFKSYPRYALKNKTGPDHDKTFWMEVDVAGTLYGPGKGKNKKEAEQAAACLAWKKISGETPDTAEPPDTAPISPRGRKKR
ncbi:MAG: ribonuclease III [Spirochaetales bacterium]|nr:ribonuclease III [Spirochaetales bacterium]